MIATAIPEAVTETPEPWVAFDNRARSASEMLTDWVGQAKDLIKRRPTIVRRGGLHLRFELNGKTFVYCYIRKNACTAVKRFISDVSPYIKNKSPTFDDISALARVHGTRRFSDICSADYRIFVYRSPVERVVSLFVNKLVIKDGSSDLENDIARTTKCDPNELTMSDFVERYIVSNWVDTKSRAARLADPHIQTQFQHLVNVKYDCAIEISNLFEAAKSLFGSEHAERYFSSRVNSSEKKTFFEDAHDITARDLRERYLRSGELPSKQCLSGGGVEALIRSIYAEDYRMISRLHGSA